MDEPNSRGKRVPPPETLDELYEHAPCGYLTTQADGTIVRVNATLLGMLGQIPEALLDRPIQSILTAGARIFYETHCAPLLILSDGLNEVSLDLVCAGGGKLPALVNWRRVSDAEGHILGFRIMVVIAAERLAYERELLAERERGRHQEAMVRELNADLEQRVAARAADLVQAQKMESLGQLTGGVAHDFNNLLTPILITLDLLHRRYITDDRALRMAASAISAAERARVLIARLLAFARRQHLRAQAVDLARLTTGLLDLVKQSAGPTIAVDLDIAPNLPPALVDQNQLEMALLNLCVNARDAMPGGGALMIRGDTVTIRSDIRAAGELAAGDYVRLSVCDNGTGMDEQTLRRATEPFYTTKTVGKGTGLGLSMVHGLAAQSGGMLTLESTPGHGATATIWLPIDPSAAPHPELREPSAAAAPVRPLSILLVDDDDLVRFATTDMLTELGHTATQAASGTLALEALHQHGPFDLLITDYMMPQMTGVELARIARMTLPGLPVLLITGYANFREAEGGGLPRLAKPYGTHDLSAKISDTLSGAGPMRTPRPSLV